jgi:hypothetical protein
MGHEHVLIVVARSVDVNERTDCYFDAKLLVQDASQSVLDGHRGCIDNTTGQGGHR